MKILVLTGREVTTLTRCERIIEKGQATFVEVGRALMQIKEEALYRSSYETFADYCEERWGFAKSQAYRLILAAKVSESVPHGGQILTERQARELGKVPKDQREAILERATEKADGKPLTARAIQETVAEIAEPEEDGEDKASEDEIRAAYYALRHFIQGAIDEWMSGGYLGAGQVSVAEVLGELIKEYD